MATPRKPSVLAYKAVRGAETTEHAREVYTAMKASSCHTADLCRLANDCPFVVDCLIADGDADAR